MQVGGAVLVRAEGASGQCAVQRPNFPCDFLRPDSRSDLCRMQRLQAKLRPPEQSQRA